MDYFRRGYRIDFISGVGVIGVWIRRLSGIGRGNGFDRGILGR